MNTNKNTINILCFGDSNTWGFIPGSNEKRFAVNIRWPCAMQNLLGNKFNVIEEGLNGRTTDMDDPKHIGKNGYTYFVACLESHKPISCLILMLGSNDIIKKRFGRKAEDVATGIRKIVDWTIATDKKTKIILINPPKVDSKREEIKLNCQENIDCIYDTLTTKLSVLAQEKDLDFIDLNTIVKVSSVDGFHFSKNSHKKIAQLISGVIKKILFKQLI